MTLYALALELSLLLALAISLGVWQKGAISNGRLSFVLCCAASMLWTLGELLLVRGLVGEVVSDRIKYAGVLAVPPLWFGFAAHAGRLPIASRAPWFAGLLALPGLCLYALLFSSRFGSLFLTTVVDGPDRYGTLWWYGAAWGESLVVAGTLVLAARGFRWRRSTPRRMRLALGLAPVAPLVGNALYLAGAPLPADPTPVLFAVTLLVLHTSVFGVGLLDALPISQREIVHQLPFGVVLIDGDGSVLDLNAAAARRLETTEADVVGESLDAVLAEAPALGVRFTPLARWGRTTGQLVTLAAVDADAAERRPGSDRLSWPRAAAG